MRRHGIEQDRPTLAVGGRIVRPQDNGEGACTECLRHGHLVSCRRLPRIAFRRIQIDVPRDVLFCLRRTRLGFAFLGPDVTDFNVRFNQRCRGQRACQF